MNIVYVLKKLFVEIAAPVLIFEPAFATEFMLTLTMYTKKARIITARKLGERCFLKHRFGDIFTI